MSPLPPKLWSPSKEWIQNSNLASFINFLHATLSLDFSDFNSLYDWSIAQPKKFWKSIFDFFQIKTSKNSDNVLEEEQKMPGAIWFPGVKLNFAENLLRYQDSKPALIFWGEDKVRSSLSYGELYAQVASVAQALKKAGVMSGDRVAGLMPNMPEAVVAMLATTSLGGVWSSCSPDFGVSGVLDRFGQIEPKVLFVSDGYYFKEQAIDLMPKLRELLPQLPSVKLCVVCSYVSNKPSVQDFPSGVLYTDLLGSNIDSLQFAQVPFNHPLYVMYSSGTTGKPKCIVHGVGGTLLEHLKELSLHTNVKRDDVIFYQTTCGWMMWNWLVSSLGLGATVVLYDGFPLHKDGHILFELAAKEKVSIFGTNAKYLSMCEKLGLCPKNSHILPSLHTILSTGSPLAPESFDYVYKEIKEDVCLSSISGGTDILGCFALGCPALPVYRGELQCRSLGLKVEVFDSTGNSILENKGELVCTAPFPSMPIYFWNDKTQEKYLKAYFCRYPNIWHHGDYVELTERGTMIFHGRSDTVLNPGGVRIGTAEIYRQVEQISEILESLAIGQDWKGDVRVVLFVRLREGVSLDDGLKEKIKTTIRTNASPFHVPKKIIQISDIPRTRSGKIVELAVRDIIHGLPVKNIEALANPEALKLFEGLEEVLKD